MPKEPATVLVVERESDATKTLIARLRASGWDVVWARDGEGAQNALDSGRVACLVCPLRAPRIEGLALMARALERDPATCTILVAEDPLAASAIEATRRGAHDVQARPLHLPRLLAVIERGLEQRRLAARLAELEARLDERFGLDRLAGHSRAMRRAIEQVRHMAATRATVLIEGEGGTGKSLIAAAIHQNSPRRRGPFVVMRCAAVPARLIEGELFGHGPSGGAPSPGRFELADGGTLVLADIEEIPLGAQVKLLRAVQDRAFEHVGGSTTLRADVRLVVTTARDLPSEVSAGRFREDLCQRVSVVCVRLPALRDRREDIPLLVERFVDDANRAHRRRITGVSRGALERLMAHDWSGNVRELRDVVERMVESARGRRALALSDLPGVLRPDPDAGARLDVAVGMTKDEAERHLILATLDHAAGDKVRAAQMLGIGLRTLYRKLQRYSIH